MPNVWLRSDVRVEIGGGGGGTDRQTDRQRDTYNLLCGDFNIDILKHNSNRGIKHFLDSMYTIRLYPHIDQPVLVTN